MPAYCKKSARQISGESTMGRLLDGRFEKAYAFMYGYRKVGHLI